MGRLRPKTVLFLILISMLTSCYLGPPPTPLLLSFNYMCFRCSQGEGFVPCKQPPWRLRGVGALLLVAAPAIIPVTEALDRGKSMVTGAEHTTGPYLREKDRFLRRFVIGQIMRCTGFHNGAFK